jgi:hypothetical protein
LRHLAHEAGGQALYRIDGLLVIATHFFFVLPITDYKTARIKLEVACVLALTLAVSVTPYPA